MKVTLDFLNEQNACSDGVEFVTEKKLIGSEDYEFLKQLIKLDKLDYANWLIVRVMARPQYLAYAIYAAEQVIDIYEKQYPNDNRPRLAIEAAKTVLKHDNKETRAAAADAASAAARAAWAAASAAARAAWAAAWAAARAAAWAAASAAASDAASAAASDAARAAAFKKMQLKILKHGLNLLREVNTNE